jgi:hypothetical protein
MFEMDSPNKTTQDQSRPNEEWMEEDVTQIRATILRLTHELISPCKYCVMISENALDPKPIRCIKATHPLHSIAISIDHCLDCGEFRMNRKAISNEECDMN